MNQTLPIFPYKQEIQWTVMNNDVVIITADTGSGKSTQVCQYMSEVGYDVVITEPRRLSARSLAERVAEEMNAILGGFVGFRTGFERNDSEETHVLFCTDGLQLVRTLTDKSDRPKILIIDEVHEWNLNIETLVAWAKKRIEEGWNTKVVIMSATLEKKELQNYFGGNTPIINVPGRLFPVTFKHAAEDEFISTIKSFVSEGHNVLAFVPGKREIEESMEELEGIGSIVLPLHGELNPEEQRRCFITYDVPKVVLATNVAQTSVTVPDIDVVVDTGLEKRTEVIDGVQGLFLNHISQSDCVQRMGRAGRTHAGVYILCSDEKFEERTKFSTPEIQRSLLDQVVLRLVAVGIDATTIQFFHQPDKSAITRAKEALTNLGAIKDDLITEVGRKMANMPISAKYARMIIEAEKLGVVDDVLTIAAILEVGTLLNRKTSYSKYTSELNSDMLAELDVWNKLATIGRIDFKEAGINGRAYFRIKELREKLFQTLDGKIQFGSSSNRELIKKACIAGMVDHLYRKTWSSYINGDHISRQLDKRSCLKYSQPEWLVGEPYTIQCKSNGDEMHTLNLVCMATKVEIEWLQEIAAQLFSTKDSNVYYDSIKDCCIVERRVYFKDTLVESKTVWVQSHPDYVRLKQEWQNDKARWTDAIMQRRMKEEEEAKRQRTVEVDGYVFNIEYGYDGNAGICIDKEQLFNIAYPGSVRLDNGMPVKLYYEYIGNMSANSFSVLRDMVERLRLSRCWEWERRRLPNISSSKKDIIAEWFPMIGRLEVTHTNSGYGGESIYGFVYLSLEGNSIRMLLTEDEDMANQSTTNAVKFLFGKEIKSKYPEDVFKIKGHDGKKIMTKKCQKAKEEFEAYAQLYLEEITIGNFEASLKELEDIFAEVTAELS